MRRVIIGIDPGLRGAIAAVSGRGEYLGVWDVPHSEVLVKKARNKKPTKQRVYIPGAMAVMLRKLSRAYATDRQHAHVTIEQVHAMPKQGVSSMFTFGRGLGMWEGIVAALMLPSSMVTPAVWKKAMLNKGAGSDKGSSIARALSLFPAASKRIHLSKHEGRAEALLLAEYWRRTNLNREA